MMFRPEKEGLLARLILLPFLLSLAFCDALVLEIQCKSVLFILAFLGSLSWKWHAQLYISRLKPSESLAFEFLLLSWVKFKTPSLL